MKFKKLIIKNFQPFDNIEQEINLETNDITLVTGFNKKTGGSNGSGKCVAKETKIMTKELGEIEIQNLIPNAKEKNLYIPKNIHVLTNKGWKLIELFWITEKENLLELELEDNKKLIASENHEVITKRGRVKLKDLQNDDEVATKIENSVSMKFVKIKNIKKLNKKENCYDIQVKDTHKYFSNGILSHNSSWIDALIWCLYGKTRDLADEVCNKYSGKKNCKVQINMEKNGVLYEIIRYRKHENQGNKLYVFENKIDKSYDSNKDTQEYINSILKISLNAFISSLVFEKENYIPFLSSTPGERSKIIENILMDANMVTFYYKKVGNILKKLEQKINELELEQREINIKNRSIDETLMQYKDSIKRKIMEAQEKISKHQKELDEYDSIENIDKIKENIIKRKELETSKESLKQSIKIMKSEKIDNTFENSEITRINKEIEKLNKEILNIENNIQICPICKQRVDKEINEKEIENKSLYTKQFTEKVNKLQSNLKAIDQINKEVDDKAAIEYSKLRDIEKNLTDLPKEKYTIEELETINEKITGLKNNIFTQQELINTAIDKSFIDEKKKEKEKHLKNYNTLDKKIIVLKNEKEYIEYFYILFGNKAGGLKKYLISKVLNVLNDKINQFLIEYFPYEINVNIDQNLNDEWIVNGESYSFKQFSSGEKMRIELSCVFALFFIIKIYLGVSSNILILDEILDLNLDTLGVKSTIDILNKLKNEGNSIFIISHKNSYIEQFENRIKITKEKNEKSRIEYI